MTADLPKIGALDSKIFAYLWVDLLNQSMSLNVALRQVVATKISIVATLDRLVIVDKVGIFAV